MDHPGARACRGRLRRTRAAPLTSGRRGPIRPAAVDAAVDRLLGESLLTAEGSRIVVSPTGSELVERVRAATNPVVAGAYAEISDDDLATAGRVLTKITVRLAAELDGAPEGTAG